MEDEGAGQFSTVPRTGFFSGNETNFEYSDDDVLPEAVSSASGW